ncbi:MAG TPA: TPM domain-containing protein [Thermoanaerobaculia bacterium]|nr:TPM domain-containing protein [Thermoanaerobaculia bacterium]
MLLLLAAISLPAKPDHYVTDHAGVLKNADSLNEKLAQFERETSDQILVYIDRKLPAHTTIEEMGSEAIKQWGVGQKGKDNGAILFVFIADRKMRIEVGYGLEGSLTDAKSKRIIETVIKPKFRSGDYWAGIDHGVDAMLATIRGEPYRGTGRTVAQTRAPVPVHTIPFVVGAVGFVMFFAVFIWIIVALTKRIQRGTSYSSSGSWSSESSSSSWSSSDSSSSSFSSSDFSGGGGSGGGGGASGSW